MATRSKLLRPPNFSEEERPNHVKTITRALAFCAFSAAGLLAADAAAGKTLYDQKCKTCHGADGKGNAAVAKTMKVTLRALGSKEVLAKSDDELAKIITAGAGKMKPVSGVSAAQAADIVAYMRKL